MSALRLFFALSSPFVIAALMPASAAALTAAEVFAKVSPAVWVVQAEHGAPGVGGAGSAIAINQRTLVTACHVVAGATSVRVTQGAGHKIIPVTEVVHDPGHQRDLCLLTVNEDLGAPAVTIAPEAGVKVGEQVYAIGAPLGLELTLTDGLVSSLRAVAGEALPQVQFSAPTAPGSSGGGLFDDQGRLIGLTVAIAAKESESLSFALPAQWAIELPKRVKAARDEWLAQVAADGVAMGPDGNASPSGFAEVNDLTKVPTIGQPVKGVTDAYRQFLLLAKPRAFVVTSDGKWGTVTEAAALKALMADCAKRAVQCKLYAVDDAVVWKP